MDCSACKAVVPDASIFCPECGAPLPLTCPSCGHHNQAGSNFCGQCGTSLMAAMAGPQTQPAFRPPQQPGPPVSSAERRQVTVMFCDLVGSTALASSLDPEDLRDVIGAYHRCVADEVASLGGFVAKYMGDGVLVYFGYPQAHEDDAERAVRTGLAVVGAVGRLKGGHRLQVRVGVATGIVVVGDLVGTGDSQERGIIGETPNLAARLQSHAMPGTIVIGPRTRLLVGDIFEYHDLGNVEVKGLAQAVHAYEIVGLSAVESRFEAFHPTNLAPLVGRDEEIELLLNRWERAKTGNGQVVLISGEPGIGKSRLTAAVLEQLSGEPHTRMRFFCSSHHADSAFYPIIGQLEHAAGFRRDDDAQSKVEKLDTLLARAAATSEDCRLIADLLSLSDTGRHPALALSPQQRRQRTIQALMRQLDGLARQQPVLQIFEDLHWIDPTSLETMDWMIEMIRGLPVLLLVTFRPEFQLRWTGRSHVATMALGRLDAGDGVALIRGIAGNMSLPEDVVSEIVERTDGVPLFVEELTKAVVEAGVGEAAASALSLTPTRAIPATLHASLMARLDRLGSAKELAQIGSVIGRDFSYELLAAVAVTSDDELKLAVRQLVASGLVFGRGEPPHAVYMFKHALVQDAAYGTLLRRTRQQLHARIVQALEERFPQTMDKEPELLARHCTEAGLGEQAVDYWRRAGQQALARCAMAEAVAQLTKGLAVLQALPGGAERQRRELSLQLALGQASIAGRGFASPQTGRAYTRASELCLKLGDVPELFPVLYGLSVFHFQRGELAEAHEVARKLLRLGEEKGDAAAQVTGHRMVGSALSQFGRFAESRDAFEAALALYDPDRDRTSAVVYAIDSRVMCLCWLAHLNLILGYPEQALARDDQVPGYVRELAHPNTTAVALSWGCIFRQLLRDGLNARRQAEEAIALATEQGFPLYRAAGTVVRGWALADSGSVEEGITTMRHGLADYGATGAEMWSPYFLGLLAQAQGWAGQSADGLRVVDDALDRAGRTGARWIESELHRIRGELLSIHLKPEQSEAEACLRRALDIAREQGAEMWELRATMSLARLWRDNGKSQEPCDLLSRMCGRLTKGFDTRDRRDAKALLTAFR